jgi:signal transduction histidine kinase
MNRLKILITLLLVGFSFSNAVAQNDSPEYRYIDSIDNDTIALAELNKVLSQKDLEKKFRPELQIKQLIRYSNVEKFDSTVFWANKYILEYQDKAHQNLPRLYSLKGSAYYYLFNLEKSKESLEKGLQYAMETKNGKILSTISNNLGAIYTEQKEYEKAIKTLKSGLEFNRQFIDSANELYFLSMRILATTYQLKKEPKQADSFFKESIKGLQEIKNFNAPYIGALSFYAQFLVQQGKYDAAKKLLDEAVLLQRKDAFQKDFSALFYNISTFYYGIKDYKTAANFLDSAYHVQYTDFHNRNSQQLADNEIKFKTQLLERDLKISKETKLKWTYAFLLLLALALGAWIVNYFNQKKKNAQVKLQQNQLAINAFIEGEEKEKARLSRELHDGIGQELLALRMQLKKDGAPIEVIESVESIGTDIRNLSHQLMPLTLKMLGLTASMEDICNKLLNASEINFSLNTESIKERLPEKLEISFYRIFQELIQNIVKHSHATEVQIQLIKMPNYINLIIEDNGIGFKEVEATKGIGLSNLTSRVQMMNGQLKYESADGDGTTTIVRIPI